ncbi:hypothetical protein H5410_035559 [Solanum commersonii]|uniref:Uncharacterized protein n=1 Tax=Solanum commersonii TaxID=4109 RepID=A0A9J5Y377_SOLCO|nr:hypothetical protein H5410_035559 [Solanum commersonii]
MSSIFSLLQKYKWQKGNIVWKKVTSGMGLVITLTNVVIIASTTMELNMVYVRSTNHGVTNITGQNMFATATHLATTKTLPVSHGMALTINQQKIKAMAKYTTFLALLLCLFLVAATEALLLLGNYLKFSMSSTYHEFLIFLFLQKYKWQKANTVGKKVTSGMDLANTLTNVVIIASTTMELNMGFVRSTNHGVTNIIGQNMLATATHLATIKNLIVSHGLKYKWQKANIVGKKVTSGMDLVNTLTNVVITANTTMELNMVFVRSTNHGATNITGQNMHVTVTHLATTKKLSVSHGLAFIM